ncbi:MAG: PQQ-binding-like beta-propeller repeat protein, partial [Thermoleophilia bacterium]
MRRDDIPRPGDMGGMHEGTGLRRATFLKAVAAAVVAPSLLAGRAAAGGAPTGLPATARDAWPQAAHDLAATRATPWAPSGLAVRWRRPVAGGMTGPPAIVHGRVVAASLGGEVAAFDLADGRE